MKKQLKDLTLLSKFLFDQTMELPEAHEAVLQIVLGNDAVRLLGAVQTEKEFRTAPWLRSIRLDVFSLDEEGTVYDTEMQGEYRNDLMKRSRYYQGLIDSSLLESGSVNFNHLNDTCIIMITPFDLFGKGKYRYTFRTYCAEDREILLKDGAVRLFLNTKGKNDKEVGQELVDFLHYVECTDGEFAEKTGSARIKRIHECVSRIKASEEMGVKYMQTWEEKVIEREQGRAEGLAQGIRQGIEQGIEQGLQALIETCREFGAGREETVLNVQKKFGISEAEARQAVCRYWEPAQENEEGLSK